MLNVPVCKEKSSHFGQPLACCVQVDGDFGKRPRVRQRDRQCSNSDVSCGGTVGSSCGWARYLRDSSLPLPRVACSLEASYTFWSCGPCCWTKAYKYL